MEVELGKTAMKYQYNVENEASGRSSARPFRASGRWIACLVMVLLSAIGTLRADPDPDYRQVLLESVTKLRSEIRGWEQQANLELRLTIAVGIAALVISALQAADAKWAKIATVILGIGSGTLVFTSQQCFDADHRAYRSLAKQADQLVDGFERQLKVARNPLSRDDYNDLSTQLEKLTGTVNRIAATLLKGGGVAGFDVTSRPTSFSFINSAYAQDITSAVPSWAKTIPDDPDNIYFLGYPTTEQQAAPEIRPKKRPGCR